MPFPFASGRVPVVHFNLFIITNAHNVLFLSSLPFFNIYHGSRPSRPTALPRKHSVHLARRLPVISICQPLGSRTDDLIRRLSRGEVPETILHAAGGAEGTVCYLLPVRGVCYQANTDDCHSVLTGCCNWQFAICIEQLRVKRYHM